MDIRKITRTSAIIVGSSAVFTAGIALPRLYLEEPSKADKHRIRNIEHDARLVDPLYYLQNEKCPSDTHLVTYEEVD